MINWTMVVAFEVAVLGIAGIFIKLFQLVKEDKIKIRRKK